MTNLFTQEEVRVLARKVGFSRRNAKIASAIAMCESAYAKDGKSYADADAVGDQALANDTWGYSYGLFQVRSLRDNKGTGKIRDEERLLDPEFNVRSARAIKISQGWRAWSVYQSGAYKAYLQDLYPPPPNAHIVVSGDSLSKIAAANGVSWQDLARWNNIHEPYTIHIGQVILLVNPLGV
jgi:hypothetical protein